MECMSLAVAMLARKSVRGFKTDPVPRDHLEQIVEVAIQSPASSEYTAITACMGRRRAIGLMELGLTIAYYGANRDRYEGLAASKEKRSPLF